MRVVNHRLVDDAGAVTFSRSPNQSGALTPEYLVIHYTAGRNAASSVEWLLNPAARASAHLLIGRDGATTQLVAFNRRAWHAGASRWAGRDGVNGFSIGIELDNPGKLERRAGGWTTAWGDPVAPADVIEAVHPNGGPVCGWHAYSGEQLDALRSVAALLVQRYRLKDVIGHDHVAPLRKTDPGPAFPMGALRAAALGRDDDAPTVYLATAVLNIRNGPGVEHPKLEFGPLPKNTRLEVIGELGVWRQVDLLDEFDGDSHRTGWVHSHYLAKA